MKFQLAGRMSGLRTSEIREILKVTQRPEVISFAGGLPAPEMFPVEEMQRVAGSLLAEEGSCALQYAPSEGYPPLRRWIADHLSRARSASFSPDEVLITCGSQQGLDLTGKLFLDEGDCLFCESPTYLAAISAFKVFGPRFAEVPTDDEGMQIGALEERLAEERPRLIYVIPNAQNPSGRTWSIDRRRRLMEIAARHEVPVIEDDPYGDVVFEGSPMPSLKAFDTAGLLVYLGTFSKILCPGLRLGWIAASRPLYEKYLILKQCADLHTSTFSQMLAARYLQSIDFEERLKRLRALYRERRDVMLSALEKEMPPGGRWTRPNGGLFVWLELPGGIDAHELLVRCVERDVAFVPGAPFFPERPRRDTARLNFSNMPPDRIREGIRRLGAAVREMLAEAGAGDEVEPEARPDRARVVC